MAEVKLKHLRRKELIEIIYALQQNELDYQAEIEDLKKQLADNQVKVSKIGSIADAAMEVNEVFLHSQRAADMYLKQIERIKDESEKKAQQIISDAHKQAELIIQDAQRKVELHNSSEKERESDEVSDS